MPSAKLSWDFVRDRAIRDPQIENPVRAICNKVKIIGLRSAGPLILGFDVREDRNVDSARILLHEKLNDGTTVIVADEACRTNT